jgi:hypothetical protein
VATITTISYGPTFNRGNFESERIDCAATLDAGEDVVEATLRLKAQVLTLGGDDKGSLAALADAEARALDREAGE